MIKHYVFTVSFAFLALWFVFPENVQAIQAHGGNEGIVVHQMSHVFFLVSMGALVYWLRSIRVSVRTGWRCIMWFALFMGLWNLDVLVMHFLDEQSGLLQVGKPGPWQIMIHGENSTPFLIAVYYIGKLDHLLCAPALYFLYKGLTSIKTALEKDENFRVSP